MTDFNQQQGLPVFYPSMVVNLQLRFDEGSTPGTDQPTPKSADDLCDAIIPSKPSTGGEQPVILDRGIGDLSQIIGIVPRSASVTIPGYRQAGTFNIELAFRDLPLDPRVIRAMAVDIHLDAVAAQDFGDGMTSNFDAATRRPSIIGTSEDNILLRGLADTVVVEYGDRETVVRIDGRDLRGMLLDTSVPAKILACIDVNKPIDEVVRHIVQKLHPQGGGVPVDVDASEWPGGQVPSPATLSDVTRANLDALGQSLRPNAKGEVQQVNFWDLITTYCFLVGGVPHFVGPRLRIRPAKTLFDARRQEQAGFKGDPDTPFSGGQPRNVQPPFSKTPEQFNFRRVVFGRDIKSLSFERKLAGVKVPVIECVSYDTGGGVRGEGRLLKVQFPPSTEEAARTTGVAPSGKTAQTDVLRIDVPGVTSKDRLETIAENLYHEIGRQELGGSVETKNLASFGGDNRDPDLVRLRPGDPVEIRVDASGLGVFPPPISELTNAEGRSPEQQIKEVAERIGDENLARVLVAQSRGEVNALQRVFRVANVKFDWSKDTGIGIAFDFQNFVEARYNVSRSVSPDFAFA